MRRKLVVIASVVLLTFAASSNGVGQWVQTNGPYVAAFQNQSLVAVGTHIFASSGGLFLSTNNGDSWTRLNSPSQPNSEDLFMVSGDRLFVWSGRELYITSDLGTTWTKSADSGLKFVMPTCFAVSGSTLFIGDGSYSFSHNAGVFRSTNNGDTWTRADSGLTNNEVHALATIGTNLFAGTSAGIFRSTNNGESWKLVDTDLSNTGIYSLAVKDAYLFAGTWDHGIPGTWNHGIIRSMDNGASWSVVDSSVSGYALMVDGPNLFAGDSRGLVRSTDNGNSWSAVNAGIKDPMGWVPALAASGPNLFAGTSTGIYRSTNNGDNWTNVTSNMIAEAVITLCVSPDNSKVYAGMSGGGAFVSTDDGEHWLRPDSGLHSAPFAMQESGANLIAATGAGLSLSTNNGASWVKTSDSGLEAGASSFAMIDSNLFLLITSGVYRSTDFGIHWTAINNGLTGPFGEADSTDLSAFVVLGTDLFASTRCCTSLFRTTNSGGDWAPSNGGLPYDAGVGSLAAIGHNLLCGVWAADSGGAGVYRSTNHGESWVLITDGLPPGHQFDQVIPCGEVTLGVMDGNLYRSLNEGASWTLIDSGEHITELVIKGTSVFAGRVECGVWRRPLSEMISTNAVASTPSAHSSITAFPNPLTQSTTITFTSPESGVAHVTIVNLLGEEVARLFDGELPDAGTGERHFPWDARGVAPGIYWCEVRMNGRVEQAAMVLEK